MLCFQAQDILLATVIFFFLKKMHWLYYTEFYSSTLWRVFKCFKCDLLIFCHKITYNTFIAKTHFIGFFFPLKIKILSTANFRILGKSFQIVTGWMKMPRSALGVVIRLDTLTLWTLEMLFKKPMEINITSSYLGFPGEPVMCTLGIQYTP